jgi:hypothetical protein
LKLGGQIMRNAKAIPKKVQTNPTGTAKNYTDQNPFGMFAFEKNINWNSGTHNRKRKQNCDMKPDQCEPCAFNKK